jgi:SulP family sulfate permease
VELTAEPKQRTAQLAAVVPSLAIAVMQVGAAVSLAVLVFTEEAATHIGTGIVTFLLGSALTSCLLAWRSSFDVVVAGARNNVTVVIAAVSAGVAAQAALQGSDQAGPTAAMFVMLAAISSGIILFLTGRFRLGYLVRFVPFPVIGGYVAGTAWLMIKGGLQVMANERLSLGTLDEFFTSSALQLIAPGIALALAIVFVPGATQQSLLIGAALVGFHLLAFATNSHDAVEADGWVIGPLPQTQGIDLFGPADLALVDWRSVADHVPGMAAVALIALTAALLNVTGVEYASGEDIDVDHELTASGAASTLSGFVGGTVGFVALGPTVLARQLNASSRLITAAFVSLAAVTVVAGPSLVGWLPRFVAGAMIMGPGIALVKRWVNDWMLAGPTADRVIALLIPLTIAGFGVLEGVGLGIVLAAGLFIWRYALIDPVRTVTSGFARRSAADRSATETRILDLLGERIAVLRLSGFLFFGTASRLGERVKTLLAEQPQLEHLILDFTLVSGADSSAQNELLKIVRKCDAANVSVRLAAMPDAMVEAFDAKPILALAVADLERTLDLAETDLIGTHADTEQPPAAEAITIPAPALRYFTPVDVAAGATLLGEGHASTELYFVTEGSFTVWGRVGQVRLRRVGPGAYLGEAGFFARTPAMATVTADGPCQLLRLTEDQLKQMYASEPDVLVALMMHVLSKTTERLARTNALVRDLSD